MAKLPDPALQDRPTPRVSGGLAQYRGSPGFESVEAPGEATARLGADIANIGEAIQQIDKEVTKARRSSQLSEAIGKAAYELGELEVSFQRDPDFKTAPARFLEKAKEIQGRHEKIIDDGLVRQAFVQKYEQLSQAKRLNVLTHSVKQEGDHNVAVLDDNLNTFASAAALAVNDAERGLIINEARLAITNLQMSGWITNVDAGKRERGFLGKIDEAIITRDMAINPIETATRISSDPKYAENLDPAARERWITHGLRRAETERNRLDTAARREREERGNQLMKDGLDLARTGGLTIDFVQSAKPFVSPSEYHSLLKAMDGTERKDDPTSFAELQTLVYTNPAEAERKALQYHRGGWIRNETLASVLSRAREVSRSEGPRTEYERSRQYITNSLDPGPFSSDPAPKARFGLAIREFDDFLSGGKRTDAEIRAKADEVVKRFALIDMNDLARRTGLGAQPTPDDQLAAILKKALDLEKQRDEKKITQQEFNRKRADLDKARKAAEKAKAVHGK